jgi:putative kinase
MENDIWERVSRERLTFDRTNAPLDVERDEVVRFYIPLAGWIRAHSQPHPRLMVAVAGPPGSGKTAFAATLTAVINASAVSRVAALVQLDGWHYSNRYLQEHTIHQNGVETPLASIKGAPETYDTATAAACFQRIQSGGEVRYPIYSRELHEPIPDGGRIEADQHIAILEGNYLLLHEAAWDPFQPLYDVRIFLSAGRETLVEGLRQRHLRGGRAPAAVEAHIHGVDLPNVDRVLQHSRPAEVVISKADSRRILSVSYPV